MLRGRASAPATVACAGDCRGASAVSRHLTRGLLDVARDGGMSSAVLRACVCVFRHRERVASGEKPMQKVNATGENFHRRAALGAERPLAPPARDRSWRHQSVPPSAPRCAAGCADGCASWLCTVCSWLCSWLWNPSGKARSWLCSWLYILTKDVRKSFSFARICILPRGCTTENASSRQIARCVLSVLIFEFSARSHL